MYICLAEIHIVYVYVLVRELALNQEIYIFSIGMCF